MRVFLFFKKEAGWEKEKYNRPRVIRLRLYTYTHTYTRIYISCGRGGGEGRVVRLLVVKRSKHLPGCAKLDGP